jgi:SAM-dependent methyltransferase
LPGSDPRTAFYPGLLGGLKAGWMVFAPPVARQDGSARSAVAATWSRTVRRIKARLVTRPAARRLRRWLTPTRSASDQRLTPASRVFGWDRGLPIDRHYIGVFMQQHAGDIRGRVLEVGDDRYAGQHGVGLERFDVLDIDEGNRRATMIADLSTGEGLPPSAFDCIILTQVLLLVYDLTAAIRQVYEALDEGGVVLATLPGISKGCPDEVDLWRFTAASARRLFSEAFGAENVELDVHGNLASTIAFLDGRAVEELTDREIVTRDPEYPLVIGVRAVRRS